MQGIDSFIKELKIGLKKYFPGKDIQYLIKTTRSLKAHILLEKEVFIAVRYNARNERTDFALIYKKQRVLGYDNLKQWHFHPYDEPNSHIPCEKPSIEEVFSQMKNVMDTLFEKE